MRAILAILPLALFATACSASGTVEVDVTSTSQAEIVAPPEPNPAPSLLPELRATITRVDVHIDDSQVDIDNDNAGEKDADSAGWATIFEGEQQINLYDSNAVARSLGSAQVPAGKVTQVRLVLKDDVVLIDDLGQRNIKCPSCSQSGLKIVTRSNVEVESDGILHLTLDFDSDASLVENSTETILKPVVHVQAVNE